jgi:hypothetical protein
MGLTVRRRATTVDGGGLIFVSAGTVMTSSTAADGPDFVFGNDGDDMQRQRWFDFVFGNDGVTSCTERRSDFLAGQGGLRVWRRDPDFVGNRE